LPVGRQIGGADVAPTARRVIRPWCLISHAELVNHKDSGVTQGCPRKDGMIDAQIGIGGASFGDFLAPTRR
jgi:hypothetical protein